MINVVFSHSKYLRKGIQNAYPLKIISDDCITAYTLYIDRFLHELIITLGKVDVAKFKAIKNVLLSLGRKKKIKRVANIFII